MRTAIFLVCGTVAFGHVHVPNSRQWQDTKLVNISSVSLALLGEIIYLLAGLRLVRAPGKI